jgi:hypothetical protein
MMAEHTPGPWKAVERATAVRASDPTIEFTCAIGEDAVSMLAFDAYLIAAAPDLLQVAELVAAHFADTDAPLGAAARAAIAKAKGR